MSRQPLKLSYCAAQVREQAPGRYAATLLAPAAARPALFGLYAFDHEIARVRRLVSEPMAGLIRLQWWRDALDAIAAGEQTPAHPVAEALRDAWGIVGSERPRLDAAIDAREREVEQTAPESLAALEDHLAATSAGPVLVALRLLGVSAVPAIEAGREIGVAIGLADLLREIDIERERVLFLPQDLLERHGIARTGVGEASSPRVFAPAVRELAALAHAHLCGARALRRAVPRKALPALLPGALVGQQLRELRALGGAPRPGRQAPLAPLRLLAYRTLGIF